MKFDEIFSADISYSIRGKWYGSKSILDSLRQNSCVPEHINQEFA